MTLNPELIAKARKGEIAILNDGSVEELQLIVKEAWPTDIPASGDSKYYFADRYKSTNWRFDDQTDLPAHSVKDFFMTDTTTDSKSYLTEITKPQSQPRTYRVTREQMEHIYQSSQNGLEVIKKIIEERFGLFGYNAQLTDTDVSMLNSIVPDPDILKNYFPSYFHIPEGEPVLVRDKDDEPWMIRISDGVGKVFRAGYVIPNRNSESWKQIIPFTKNPPK